MQQEPNAARVKELSGRKRAPKFALGATVREPHGGIGAIAEIYADFAAALDSLIVEDDWYDLQSIRPKTPKTGIWYGVVLLDGAVLVGEDDLVELS